MRLHRRLTALAGSAALLSAACDSPVGFDRFDCESPYPRLDIGRSVNGSITTSDRIAGDGTYYDPYTLYVRESGSVGIEMWSDEVDSYLVLFDEWEDRFIDDDDDSGGDWDAAIYRYLDRGCYVVWANTYEPETGRYTISAFRR